MPRANIIAISIYLKNEDLKSVTNIHLKVLDTKEQNKRELVRGR